MTSSSQWLEQAKAYRDSLLEDTLPFWLEHGVDKAFGGFSSCLSRDGSCYETDKSGWVQGRFTWLLAKTSQELGIKGEVSAAAEHGISFIRDHGYSADRRLWFTMTREGSGLRKRRYAYTEFFASMAFAQWSRLSDDAAARAEAERLFLLACDDMRGGRGPAKFEDVRASQALGFPMITLGVAHELEGICDAELIQRERDAAVAKIRTDFVHSESGCLLECVGLDGSYIDHAEGRQVNPGHAIEAAWFLMEEHRRRPNADLLRDAIRILDSAWELGWDPEYGGLLSLVDISGAPVQEVFAEQKYWWPHCEAIIAMLYAALLTRSPRHVERWRLVHDWAHDHFSDPDNGEWFGYLRRDGSVFNSAKGNMWKGPFHVPRMQLIGARLCEALAREVGE